MTTLESLISIIGNISRSERKLVRRYLIVRSQSNPSKTLKLFDLLYNNAGRNWSTADLEKRLDLHRHHAAFARIVSHLRKRVIEALSLPIIITNDHYSERTKAIFHFHQQYLKAVILFEAGDYDAADETLLSLTSWTSDFELYAEQIAVVEFLIRIIRINGNPEVIQHFKDVPQHSRRLMTLISSAESIREMVDNGLLKEAQHQYGELKWFAKESNSTRALFALTGIEGKAAQLRGDYEIAERFFIEQLSYCDNDAVKNEENIAQTCADIAQNAIHLKKSTVAKEYLEKALRCRKVFKTTSIQLEHLKKEILTA